MTVIIKLGGSLMCLPDLAEKLRSLIDCHPDKQCIVVVGGGASADIVRNWSEIHQIQDEPAHWLALSSLNLNRQLIEELTGWKSVSSRLAAASGWSQSNLPLLLDLKAFTSSEEEHFQQELPHNWKVTSDSLAAWVAIRWPADELILVKSVDAPRHLEATEASRAGLVDEFFPELARRFSRIHWCNLRASSIKMETWLS